MSETPGKRLERKFRESLKARADAMGGYGFRLMDAGSSAASGAVSPWAKRNAPADFFHADPSGDAWLFECKATRAASLPFAHISEWQLASLSAFDRTAPNFHGVVAVNFYDPDSKDQGELVLVGVEELMAYRNASARKSLPKADAMRIGRVMRRSGPRWRLDL